MTIIDGKKTAKDIRAEIKEEICKSNLKVGLAVVLVGENDASKIYVRNKINACEEVGIKSFFVHLDENSTFDDVAKVIDDLNNNPEVNGIMLQLPLPSHLNETKLLDLISPLKDADGCHYVQKGRLWTGRNAIKPCTPYGVIEMLNRYGIEIAGKNAVVVGRSNLVGKPLAQLLLDENATVTICHSKTENLKEYLLRADIVCSAVGKAHLITADMIKDGAIVVDIGINRDENGKLCGDVDYEEVAKKCSYITPVPGGVGPMTVTMLMKNALELNKIQKIIADKKKA